MLMPNSNIANFDAANLGLVVEVTCDDDYVFVRFHSETKIEQYAFGNRRSAARRGAVRHGGMQHIADMMQDAASILSADGLKRLLIDNGFSVVQ
jgi:calcineurin-like phosphoesterase